MISTSSFRLGAYYALNAQAFTERVYRLLGVSLMALVRPAVAVESPAFATRMMHLHLCGMSRDRLDLLGEEYLNYVLRPRLMAEGVEQVKRVKERGREVVLVSQELDHLIRPMAQHLEVKSMFTNRLEFRDDLATGRLLNPVVPSLGWAGCMSPRERGEGHNGEELQKNLDSGQSDSTPAAFILPTSRQICTSRHAIVNFGKSDSQLQQFSVRKTLAGKKILLIGGTGFIGKVWLTMLLEGLPEIGHIHLLIRRQGSRTALQRFEKIVAESPAFKTLHDRFGEHLGEFLFERIEVLEGDVTEPQFGLHDRTAARLFEELDVIVNSAGLTDFNPDLRLALATNADSTLNLVDFVRKCRHAGLVHVSTCFVNGKTDGRVPEELQPDYTPKARPDFDARREWELLHAEVDRVEREAESEAFSQRLMAEVLRRIENHSKARAKKGESETAAGRNLQNQVRRTRTRWIRDQLIDFGVQRARHWGWPNIYTFTKSLGESLLAAERGDLPISIARPSIVESSISQPFRGWNEGVNTTAPLSYLLGTYFRQLPSNKRKRLDVIPVDLVCRGLTLISAAVVCRCHQEVYQLATSAINPANMRRTIELTGLAHRKYYRSMEGLEHWLRARFDTISVSKTRYNNVSLPRFKGLLQGVQTILSSLALKGEGLARRQRALEKVQKVIELYEPFILDNEYFFAADHIKALAQALPEEEVATFGYDAAVIDWYDYWINLHVPALRRWSYPLIEGRRPETGLLPRNFKLPLKPGEEKQDSIQPSDGEPGKGMEAANLLPMANRARE